MGDITGWNGFAGSASSVCSCTSTRKYAGRLAGAVAGAALSLAYALTDAFGLSDRHLVRRAGVFLVFTGAATLIGVVDSTVIGALALTGSAVALSARACSAPRACSW